VNYFIKKNKMNCKICFEQYNKNKHKPVILMQCGHSICITCLNELTTFLCPICREQIITSKPNYDLIDLLEQATNQQQQQQQVTKSFHTINLKEIINNDLKYLNQYLNKECEKKIDKYKFELNRKTNEILKNNKIFFK